MNAAAWLAVAFSASLAASLLFASCGTRSEPSPEQRSPQPHPASPTTADEPAPTVATTAAASAPSTPETSEPEPGSCECPSPGPRPATATHELWDIGRYDANGQQIPAPFDVSSGTIAVSETQLVIRYVVDGTDVEVAYSIPQP